MKEIYLVYVKIRLIYTNKKAPLCKKPCFFKFNYGGDCLVKYISRPHEKAQKLSLGERNGDVDNRESKADYAAIGDAS
jgi:hypothetical protein